MAEIHSATPQKPGLPWHWLIFLPVLASVIAGLSTLAIAIRYGDRPLPETVAHTGPVQYGEHTSVDRARTLGLSATAEIDPVAHGIVLKLVGGDLPPRVELRLWHPTDANLDHVIVLTRGDDGSYRGAWPAAAQGLLLLLTAPEAAWELPGALDTQANTLRFVP